ncbi:hypothetical protein [Nitrospira moscoviensis]|uniref:Uncharacterized protein n=1 Tax=Nitrospira moscoviensis TaxID=42253 RepID=A0A0K2GDJ7_NITMO|nr:hypothetical protein [Nitrospira moscoviensis]ALA59030.1 hypothetical protein NITMOv2_2617 [Nitrospira moscoviensis]
MQKSDAMAPPSILPVCCLCHQVPDEDAGSPGAWTPLQDYLDRHHLSEGALSLSHTYCPSCYVEQAQAWHLPQVAPARSAA